MMVNRKASGNRSAHQNSQPIDKFAPRLKQNTFSEGSHDENFDPDEVRK